MPRIVIRGRAAAFRDDDEQVTDPSILQSLAGLVYDDERFTDYLGGPGEDELAAALESGGFLHFGHRAGDDHLTVETTYQSNRPLTSAELRLLVEYTMGQWYDGIGENWTGESHDRYGYAIVCIAQGAGSKPDYPDVDVLEDFDEAG